MFNPERRKRLELLSSTSMYAPHTKAFHDIADQLHFRDDGAPALITDDDLEYLRVTDASKIASKEILIILNIRRSRRTELGSSNGEMWS